MACATTGRKDLKVKYKRSVLGYLESFKSIAATNFKMSIVFSYIFRFNIENFPVYLICGQVLLHLPNRHLWQCLLQLEEQGFDQKSIYSQIYTTSSKR